MNILVFLAGVSVGWAADKLYNSYMAKKTHGDEENETGKKSLTKKESLKEIRDDLSQLKGVGPKLAEALDTIGIYNYEQLSEPPVDILLERLRETGGKFSIPVISVIMERAKQAAEER
ncbi:MAG: hypothetical protein KZQ83_02995 [gamma proteobacterium symbiont of Taylorina sp.]|nr:hypothetical protein [gamma proteobacterium symbiont of Taylorina sp.]